MNKDKIATATVVPALMTTVVKFGTAVIALVKVLPFFQPLQSSQQLFPAWTDFCHTKISPDVAHHSTIDNLFYQ